MDCWSKIQGRLVDLILWCWWLLVCKSSLKSDWGGDGAESSPLAVVWLERTAAVAVLTVPLALTARAFRGGAGLASRPAVVTSGVEGGWHVLPCCGLATSQQGHCEGISPVLPTSSSTCSSREARPGLGSLLPSPGGAFCLDVLRCPGNSDTFRKEMFSLNIYTGAAWRWC